MASKYKVVGKESKITVRVKHINRLSPTLVKLGRQVDAVEARVLREAHRDAVDIFKEHAPGRIADGVIVVGRGSEVEIFAYAKDPLSGYDYVGVSRLGHKKAVIKPRRDRSAASVLATGKPRKSGKSKKATLRIPLKAGGFIYRQSIKGYRPKVDWAEVAQERVTRNSRRILRNAAKDFHL